MIWILCSVKYDWDFLKATFNVNLIATEFILNTISQFLRILNIALRMTFPSSKFHTLERERKKEKKNTLLVKQLALELLLLWSRGFHLSYRLYSYDAPTLVNKIPGTGQAYGKLAVISRRASQVCPVIPPPHTPNSPRY